MIEIKKKSLAELVIRSEDLSKILLLQPNGKHNLPASCVEATPIGQPIVINSWNLSPGEVIDHMPKKYSQANAYMVGPPLVKSNSFGASPPQYYPIQYYKIKQ